jgi:hypothetical protein
MPAQWDSQTANSLIEQTPEDFSLNVLKPLKILDLL